MKRIRKICMNLGNITGAGIDYFMNLTLEELFEIAEEVTEEVNEHRKQKKQDLWADGWNRRKGQ